MKPLLIVGVGLLAATEANAFCTEPPPSPICVAQSQPFQDQNEYNRCRRELEAYKIELEIFLSCLRAQSNDAFLSYQEALDNFVRRSAVEQ